MLPVGESATAFVRRSRPFGTRKAGEFGSGGQASSNVQSVAPAAWYRRTWLRTGSSASLAHQAGGAGAAAAGAAVVVTAAGVGWVAWVAGPVTAAGLDRGGAPAGAADVE